MYLPDLFERLPGKVLSKRISREEVQAPQYTMFLLTPGRLDPNILYILDSASAQAVLPGCTAPCGATVFCAGAIPSGVNYQASINFISADCGLLELHNSIGAYLSTQRLKSDIDAELMCQKFAQIVGERVLEDNQVDSLCRSFPKRLRSSYCVIYIETPKIQDKTYRVQLIQKDLEELFHDDNITVYDDRIIVIHSYDGFTHPPKIPKDELSALLGKYGACAGISNGMRKTSAMKTMYNLAKRALEEGRALDKSGSNIYYYDDTMFYSIISYATSTFRHQVSSDDIILLGNPVLLNLTKHDPDGKWGFLDILYQYIVNGKSITKTAEAMHMHRNTVQKRMSMIEEIIGDRFKSDGLMQSKLLLTYYIIQYFKNVLHREVVLSPLCDEMEKVVKLPQRE